MVRSMRAGSVIIDLAAERGGNCELTKPGETVVDHGVKIVGAVNLAVPHGADRVEPLRQEPARLRRDA